MWHGHEVWGCQEWVFSLEGQENSVAWYSLPCLVRTRCCLALWPQARGRTASPASAEDQGRAQAKAGNEQLPGQSCSEGQMTPANIEDEAVQPGQRSVCQPQLGCDALGLQLCWQGGCSSASPCHCSPVGRTPAYKWQGKETESCVTGWCGWRCGLTESRNNPGAWEIALSLSPTLAAMERSGDSSLGSITRQFFSLPHRQLRAGQKRPELERRRRRELHRLSSGFREMLAALAILILNSQLFSRRGRVRSEAREGAEQPHQFPCPGWFRKGCHGGLG